MRSFVLLTFGFETTLPALRVQSTGPKHKGDKRQVRVESSQSICTSSVKALWAWTILLAQTPLTSHMHCPDIQNTCVFLLLWAGKFESDLSQAFTCLLLIHANKVCPKIVNKYIAFLERLWESPRYTLQRGHEFYIYTASEQSEPWLWLSTRDRWAGLGVWSD